MAGSGPFQRAYDEQRASQVDLIRKISSSQAEAEASKYKTVPNPPKTGGSFADGLAGPLSSTLGQVAQGVIGSIFKPGSTSFSSSVPWNFNSGLNFLPSGSSGTASNFSSAGISGPSFKTTALNFLK
jgi:hypothetical protein